MIYELELGDWSDDGHGKTETVYVDVFTYGTGRDLASAYSQAKEIIGFGLEDIAEKYEMRCASLEQAQRLVECGFQTPYEWTGQEPGEAEFFMTPDIYVEILEFMLQINIPGLKLTRLKSRVFPQLIGGNGILTTNCVGYGMFF